MHTKIVPCDDSTGNLNVFDKDGKTLIGMLLKKENGEYKLQPVTDMVEYSLKNINDIGTKINQLQYQDFLKKHDVRYENHMGFHIHICNKCGNHVLQTSNITALKHATNCPNHKEV